MFQILLLQTVITISRYMCVFWLNDPASFQDDFWTLFINIWIAGFSYISQFIFIYQPGIQAPNFYIFSGKNPANDATKPFKLNVTLLSYLFLTVIIQAFVSLKIYIYKIKTKTIITEQNYKKRHKKIFLATVESQTLVDVILITSTLIGFAFLFVLFFKLLLLEPCQWNEYPNYLIIYWINSVNFLFMCTVLSLLSYYRNTTMRKMMIREIKEFFRK